MKVKELKDFLNKFDDDTEVYSFGPDSGGYDVTIGILNQIQKVSLEGGEHPVIYYSEERETPSSDKLQADILYLCRED
jgi:hypothetical protein